MKNKRLRICRVAITIIDARGKTKLYSLTPVPPEKGELKAWELSTHRLAQTTRGHLTCTCPGYAFSTLPAKHCKHTDCLVAIGISSHPPGELDRRFPILSRIAEKTKSRPRYNTGWPYERADLRDLLNHEEPTNV